MVRRVIRDRNIVNYSEGGGVLYRNQVPSSQESSESEFVEEEKPWPPLGHQSRCKTLDRQVRRVEPRPQSHLFRRGSGEGKERRSRHSRRWENCTIMHYYETGSGCGLTYVLCTHCSCLPKLIGCGHRRGGVCVTPALTPLTFHTPAQL